MPFAGTGESHTDVQAKPAATTVLIQPAKEKVSKSKSRAAAPPKTTEEASVIHKIQRKAKPPKSSVPLEVKNKSLAPTAAPTTVRSASSTKSTAQQKSTALQKSTVISSPSGDLGGQLFSPSTPVTPATLKATTEMRCVAFRPLDEPEIVGSDTKLVKFYAPCSGFWLRGVIRSTDIRKITVVVAAPAQAAGKKVKAPRTVADFVPISTINWVDTRFTSHEPKISMATMIRGMTYVCHVFLTNVAEGSKTLHV